MTDTTAPNAAQPKRNGGNPSAPLRPVFANASKGFAGPPLNARAARWVNWARERQTLERDGPPPG